jgi:hypothetical protein
MALAILLSPLILIALLLRQLELGTRQKRFLRSRWLDQLSWLEGKAKQCQQRYYRLRLSRSSAG